MSKKIQHIHIPKCAGSSLFKAMNSAMGPGHGTIALDSIALYLTARRLKKCRNEFEFESHHLSQKETLLTFYLSQGWSLISGHLPFSPLCHSIFSCNYDFITVLREPISRLRSHIAYLIFAQPRTCVEDYLSGKIDPADEARRILLEDSIGEWLPRTQSIYLGGLVDSGGPDLNNRVPQAIEALDKLALVGFDHQMDPFIKAIEKRYALDLSLERENRMDQVQPDAKLRQRVFDVLDGELSNVVREMSADDITLYEAALSKSGNLGIILNED